MASLRMVYVRAGAAPGGDGSPEHPFASVAEAVAALDAAARSDQLGPYEVSD